MKISIIVPIYNVEKYIHKCIKSILEQSFNDYELILVDDGSPDKCGEICDRYAESDERIKVIHKQNGGLSSARNAGLDIASGEYIAFVDSDDWIATNMYEEMYKVAKKTNADIIQCGFIEAVDDSIEIISQKDNEKIILTNVQALHNLYNEKYIETVVSWNKIYKKELFKNIRFPMGKLHEDEYTTHKLLYKCKKIAVLNKALYYYRQTPNSIMNSEFNIKRFDRLGALNERAQFFKDRNLKDLYKFTINKYVYVAKDYYFKYRSSKNYNKNLLNDIKKDYFYMFIMYFKENKFKVKGNIMNLIFLICPSIYKKLKKV